MRLTRLVVTPAVAAACALLMFAPVSPSAAAPTVAAAKKCDATKETKTTKDDKVVAFLADHADDLVDYIAKKAGVTEKPVPREKVVDPRTGK